MSRCSSIGYLARTKAAIGTVDEEAYKINAGDTTAIFPRLWKFTVTFKDSVGADNAIDLRYVYLYYDIVSMMNGKMTFNEVFRQIPCMPDDLIKKNKEAVRKNKESVYNSLYGSTLPVSTPFDD